MGYYIRVLGAENNGITVHEIAKALEANNLLANVDLSYIGETLQDWEIIKFRDLHDNVHFVLEKNLVIEGQLGGDEIEEFKEEIEDCKPTTAVKWLNGFFIDVKVIYAFQLFDSVYEDENWKILETIKTYIWNRTSGIIQVDYEGFTNQDGYHILWQFNENVTGNWAMALLDDSGSWVKFEMDLGDLNQREQFFRGEIPSNVTLL